MAKRVFVPPEVIRIYEPNLECMNKARKIAIEYCHKVERDKANEVSNPDSKNSA